MVKQTRRTAQLLLWLRHARRRAFLLVNYKVWILSAVIGVVVGYLVIGFSLAIDGMSAFAYGEGRLAMASGIRNLNPARAWIVPVLGGVLVGTLLYLAKRLKWLPEAKCQGVAEVIEARAGPPGHVSFRAGVVNTFVAITALGSGASAGREGPAVLLGGAISTALAERFGLSGKDARILLGCGAAAAVAASFNAPIAGMLFALEVILGNYALSVFGPVALSSIAAAVVARIHLSDVRAFVIPLYGDSGPWDIPFSAALGLVCGGVAFVFLQGTSSLNLWVRKKVAVWRIEPALLPPIAGMVMGTIALFYPEVLGVGYEATTEAIQGSYSIRLLTILLVAKLLATMVCLSCRFGTGVFSGGLVFGAMSGAAFGAVLGHTVPGLTADPTFYAMVGMGAVSGAILGAPISTTLIVFELTGDYQMTIALMLAVGIATIFAQSFFGASWFHWQLNQRGYDLSEGPQGVILQTIRVRDVMRPMPEDSSPLEEGMPRLRPDHSLGEALARMRDHDRDGMPVTDKEDRNKVIGYITQVRALAVYNRALVDSNIEHHR